MTAALTTLFNDDEAHAEGAYPIGRMISDASGNLFGTRDGGGGAAYGWGTVFELDKTESGYASVANTLAIFDNFNGDGASELKVMDASGNLFGVTEGGGEYSKGIVFEIAKTASGYASTPTTLFSFDGDANGEFPTSLIMDASGNLFGTTGRLGAYGGGTVFMIAKTASGYASTPTTLVSFGANPGEGAWPNGLVIDADGNLLGTTYAGGVNDAGTVFEIAKTGTGYASTPITLVNFGYGNPDPGFGYTNGSHPGKQTGSPPLVMDASGNLFGTTEEGGAYGWGTVFEVVKTPTGYSSTPPTLVSFDQPNSSYPNGTLVIDAAGNLFGMTRDHDAYDGSGGGMLFEIVNTSTGYAGTPTPIAVDGLDAFGQASSLMADAFGNLFGVAREVLEITGSGFAVNDMADFSSDAQSGGTEGVFVDLADGGAKDGFGALHALTSTENVRGTNSTFPDGYSAFPDGSGVGDVLLGSASDDVFQGLSGADHIDGRGGSDTADYSADAQFGGNTGIYADLGDGAVVDGFGNTDVLVSVENIIGTDSPGLTFAGYSDVILGSDDANRIDARGGADIVIAGDGDDIVFGGTGNDYLSGGGGNDTIIGGEGNDMMLGGGGSDTFRIDLASLISGQSDTINDFLPGTDRILFSQSAQGLVFGDGYIGSGTGLGEYYALFVAGATAAQLQAATFFD